MSATPVLEVRNLKKHFPVRRGVFSRLSAKVHAVDGISFSIGAGETLGLVGESGCGKSTAGKLILKLIEPFEIGAKPYLGADHVHLLVQAKQLAFHDRDRWLADPRFAEVPVARLLSARHLEARRRLIDPGRALAWDRVPSYGSLAGDTVYIAAVDRGGNAASLIFSLYGVFGSCVTAGSTGVVLQNRGAYFSLDPAHPNRLEPGKVPLHTLIASLALSASRAFTVAAPPGAYLVRLRAVGACGTTEPGPEVRLDVP